MSSRTFNVNSTCLLPRWTSGDADNIMGTDPQGAAFALVGGK